MISTQSYIRRRQQLTQQMQSGVVIIPGSMPSPNSYPNNCYPFRQDSSFRYLFGANIPSLVGVVDIDSWGRSQSSLYGDDTTIDDVIWSGDRVTVAQLADESGVDSYGSVADLRKLVELALRQRRQIHILPPYRAETKLQLMELLGCQREVDLQGYISPKLALVVSALREIKDSDEIAELEEACRVGCMMHQRAMRLTIAGLSEHAVAGEVDGIARSEGQGVSFSTIYTQHGEILHGSPRRDLLRDGAMVLCDAGAESHSGYCSDHTRTYPVSGKFSDVQRDIYNIVLDVHNFVAQSIKPNIYYRDLQNMTLRMLADRLKEFGLLRGSLDEIMESGAVKLFMPHGVGHGLGMDVHDCEALGGRYLDFEGYEQEIEHYGSSIFREWWTLREGGVMTNEPGVYFIGALIEKSLGEGFYRGIVNYNMALSMRDFGGVRIEDDYLVTAQGCRPIKSHLHIPKSVAEIEEYMRSCR